MLSEGRRPAKRKLEQDPKQFCYKVFNTVVIKSLPKRAFTVEVIVDAFFPKEVKAGSDLIRQVTGVSLDLGGGGGIRGEGV